MDERLKAFLILYVICCVLNYLFLFFFEEEIKWELLEVMNIRSLIFSWIVTYFSY